MSATGPAMSVKKGGELLRRVVVAGVGVPLAILVVWQGGWLLGIAMALVAGISASEYFELASSKGGAPLSALGIAAAAAFPLGAAVSRSFDAFAPWAFGGLLLLTLLALGGAPWSRGVEGSPTSAAAATVSGVLYTGVTLAFALLLRHLPDTVGAVGWDGAFGTAGAAGAVDDPAPGIVPAAAVHGGFLVAFPITVTWVADSAAYFAGRRWGRKKLVPRISPGKTVVGGLAGLLAAVVTAVAYAVVFLPAERAFGLAPLAAGAIGLAVGVAAQIGDLAESVLKREAGVKDSGTLLPGHGGALDRFDALFFTIPLTYLLLVMALSSAGTLGG